MVDLFTTNQAALKLGYTLQHVRLLIRQGKISGVKIGRDWLIKKDTVNIYRNRRRLVAK